MHLPVRPGLRGVELPPALAFPLASRLSIVGAGTALRQRAWLPLQPRSSIAYCRGSHCAALGASGWLIQCGGDGAANSLQVCSRS